MKNLSLFNKFLYIINIVLVLLWFCAFLSPYINPQLFSLGAVLAIGFPLLILTHSFFVFYWLVRFNKVIYLSTIVLVLSYLFSVPLFQTKSKYKVLAKDNSLSLLSFNSQLFYFDGGSKEDVQKLQGKVSHFLNQQNTDIVCLQESRQSLSSSLNYPFNSIHGYNQIYSKYPIVNAGLLNFEEQSTNQSSYADILVYRDTIRVYNLHLESLHLGNEDYSLLKEWDEKSKENKFQKKTQKLKNKISKASSKRVNQVEKIIESLNACSYRSIISGDFNDVAQSYIYRKLNENHKDAFIESGKGFGATYRQLLFPFRIDYILTHKDWSTYNFEVLDEKLSDHQAIRCDIEIND